MSVRLADRPTLAGRFELETDLAPQGDQPKAIEEVVQRLKRPEKFVTLLGVTGSGKTFTMAHVVARLQRPTLVVSPNKTLAAQLVSEFRALFPRNAVEYFVSYYDYYQPEAYVPQIDLYVEKDASINEEIDRLRHRATQALLTRRDVLIVASVSCIYGLGSPEDYRSSVVGLTLGQEIGRQELLAQLVRIEVHAQRHRAQAGPLPRSRRHDRRDGSRRDGPSDRPGREQCRLDHRARPADPGGSPRGRPTDDIPRDTFHHDRRARATHPGRYRPRQGEPGRRVPAQGEGRGGTAAQEPDRVRPRDDPGDRLLFRHRELRALLLRAQGG